MIQTSYFANYRNFPDGKRKISISRFTPKWFKEDYNALELAPSAELLLETKAGNVNDDEYEERYIKETLSKLDPKEIAWKYKDSIFLCYERADEFCHRQIVAKWLNDNGVIVEEVKNIVSIYVSIRSEDFNEEFFIKVMDRLLSNYKNIHTIICDDAMVYKYCNEKGIQTALIDEYSFAIVFKDNNDYIEFADDVEKVYIVNGESNKITLQ